MGCCSQLCDNDDDGGGGGDYVDGDSDDNVLFAVPDVLNSVDRCSSQVRGEISFNINSLLSEEQIPACQCGEPSICSTTLRSETFSSTFTFLNFSIFFFFNVSNFSS